MLSIIDMLSNGNNASGARDFLRDFNTDASHMHKLLACINIVVTPIAQDA